MAGRSVERPFGGLSTRDAPFHRLAEDLVAELGLEGRRCHEVDAVTDELTELRLKTHELKEANRAAEFDEQIHIAIVASLVTCKRAEQRQTGNTEGVQNGTVFAQRLQDIVAWG